MDDIGRERDGMDERRRDTAEVTEAEGRLREALKRDFATPRFPGAEIEDRIRASVARRGTRSQDGNGPAPPWWSGGTTRAVLAAAASLVLFVGGMEYGRRTAVPIAPVAPTVGPGATTSGPVAGATEAAEPTSLPLSIQSAGTRYVATLARFTGEADGLAAEERRLAREVALAALYGAAVELLREAGEDDVLRAVAEMVAVRRGTMSGDGGPSALSF